MSKRARRSRGKTTSAIVCALALSFFTASPASANVVWPGLAIGWSTLMLAVPFGILIEYLVVQGMLLEQRALAAVLVPNLVSAVAGIVLYPILASMAEIVPQLALAAPVEYTLDYDRAYNWLTLTALIPLAALVSTVIEMPVMVKRFALLPGARSFKILLGANLASTAIAALGAGLVLM